MPLPSLIRTMASALVGLLLATPGMATAGNNLHLIPGKGVKYGIVKRAGQKIKVQLQRSKDGYFINLNDSHLSITFIDPSDPDAPLVFNKPTSSPFAEVYPNGAYQLSDPSHDLLASRGCWQVGSPIGGWNGQAVLCDVASVGTIQVKTYKGNDRVTIDPSVTVPVDVRCHATQTSCGTNCLTASDNTCCDVATGCFVPIGGDCATLCPP